MASVYQCSFLRAAVGKVDAGDARGRYLLFPSEAPYGAGTHVRAGVHNFKWGSRDACCRLSLLPTCLCCSIPRRGNDKAEELL